MSKNKLAKFADMERYPHVFQAADVAVNDEPFAMKGRWHEDFSTMTILLCWNSAAAVVNTQWA